MELTEVLKELPLPALLVFAGVLAVVVGVRFLGVWQGMRAPPAPETKAQVAAVIVDPTALQQAAGEVAGLTIAVTEAMAVVRAHTAAVDRQSDKIEQLTNGVDDLRTELIRAAAKVK